MTFARRFASRMLAAIASPGATIAVGRPLYVLAGRHGSGDVALKNLAAILVARPDEIGDVILTTPFLRELRRNAPHAWITLVVKPQTADIVEHCPYVNEILTFDWNVDGRAATLKRHVRALRLAAQRLWRSRFDMAILPRRDADFYHGTFLTYFSGASRRVGYSENATARKQALNPGYDRMLTDVVPPGGLKHEVEHNLDVIRFLGGEVENTDLEVWLDEKDRTFASTLLKAHGIEPGEELVALAPGARWGRKQWPVLRFAEVAQGLRGEHGARFVVVGGAEDRPLGEQLEAELGGTVLNAAGRTTLRQTTALLERCRLTITNDSGPMHLAAAVGCPVLEVSWHTREEDADSTESPARFGPWGVPHAIIRPEHSLAPCRGACESDKPHCILGVQAGQVVEAASSLLEAPAFAKAHEP